MKLDPLDNPTRNAATHRNLVNGMRFVSVQPWLEDISFDRLVEAWWAAQARKSEREERRKTTGRVRE